MLHLYDLNKNKIEGLANYKDYKIESVLDTGDKTLSFLYPSNLSQNILEECYIKNKTDEFVIKEVKDDGNWKSIVAVMNVEDLEGQAWEHFDCTNQNVEQCLTLVVAGTGWIVEMINSINKKRTVKKTNCSTWDLIQEAKKVYRVELEFDTLNKIVKVYEKLGSKKGAYFIDSLNLKELELEANSYDYYTRILAIGKDDIKVLVENYQYSKKIKTFIWKDEKYTDIDSLKEDAILKLNELSKPRKSYRASIVDLASMSDKYKDILDYKLGDMITLISKDLKIKEEQRIVKIVEYPDDTTKNDCEMSNTTLSFKELQKEFKDTSETVSNITEDNGKVSEKAIKEAVDKITIDKADIDNLNAAKARIGTLEATTAKISQLDAINANIVDLKSNKANITDLTAANIKVSILEGDTANLQTILSKFISGENGQLVHLTSENVVIDNAVIKSAMIDSLDVSKITAGDISTNKFRIISDSGKMLIADNTIQINDSNRTRVQIGKDAANDYNMYVWDSTGKVMFDAAGLKSDGIKSKIIRDDMITDNANINGSKINISSLVTEVNKDNNTQLIKASKVALDTTGQSLEISFNSLKSNVDNIDGRNLLLNSGAELDLKYWTKQENNGEISIEENDAYYGKKAFRIKQSSGTAYQTLRQNIKVTPDEKIAISGFIKVLQVLNSSSVVKLCCNYYKADGSIVGSINVPILNTVGDYKKVNFDLVMPNDAVTLQIVLLVQGGEALFDNIKVEKDRCTEWTPAPEEITKEIESNTTSINVINGQIDTLIKDTTIEENGATVKLKDSYSSLKQTVNGINSTVASHNTSITTLNTSVGNVQNTANNANSLADSKAKVFTSTPTTPYKIGDIWTSGPSGDIMKCKVARASGAYVATDWEKASKYTDDTKANAVEGNLNILSGKVTTVESKQATLEQNLDGFKTTVSSTYSTKTELNAANGNISSLSSRVSTAESSITQLDKKIALKVEQTDVTNAMNNLEIGGANRALDTKTVKENSTFTGGSNNTHAIYKILTSGFEVGKKATISFDFEYTNLIGVSGQSPNLTMQGSGDVTAWNSGSFNSYGFIDKLTLGSTTTKKVKITYSFIITVDHLKNNYWLTNIRSDYIASGSFKVSNFKAEKGDKCTSWTPAPEDVDQSIATVDGKVTTLNTTVNNTVNKVSTIEANLTSITSRVSSTESSIATINGNVTSLQTRMSSAEQKITDSAIIATVSSTINNAKTEAINAANGATDGKLQGYATKSSLTQTSDSIVAKFSSSGGYNIVKNGGFKNGLSGWWEGLYNPNGTNRSLAIWGDSSEFVLDGTCALVMRSTNNTTGEFRADSQKFKVKKYTNYTISYLVAAHRVAEIGHFVRGNEWEILSSTSYCPKSGGKNRNDWTRVTQTFNSRNNYQVSVNFLHLKTGNDAYSWVTDVIINEGDVALPWSPHPSEIYEGSTVIDGSGVTIKNGALKVLNNSGQVMLQGDSSGNLSFSGKLQPCDYQIRLFGNDCRIDGSAGAIRMQYTPATYISVDSAGAFRLFNQNSNNGTRYVSINYASDGHATLYNNTTMLKLLYGATPQVQARNTGDNAYCSMAASGFITTSSREFKTEIEAPADINFINLLKTNNIKKYKLKADVERLKSMPIAIDEYGEGMEVYADTKLGFILEELTEEARKFLNPRNTPGIDTYSMCSMLWKIVQEQQKRIEALESPKNYR